MAENYEAIDFEEIELDSTDDTSGFRLLDEGFYPFMVKSVKKGFSNNSAWPRAEIELKVGEGFNSTTVTDFIQLHSGMKWKFAQLFLALGMRKHGEHSKLSIKDTVGRSGWLEIEHREYTRTRDGNGKKAGDTDLTNQVKRYLEPDDAPTSKPAAEDTGW